MLSEFNFSCFEKPNLLSINALTRFHAFCFSCYVMLCVFCFDSARLQLCNKVVTFVETKLASTAVGGKKGVVHWLMRST